ncbi:MAG: DUF1272 domain-containing protein [Planctomycetota bacterium]
MPWDIEVCTRQYGSGRSGARWAWPVGGARGMVCGMSLEMRAACERCQTPTPMGEETWICSYECTFCPRCASEMERVCPNCGGELVRRPRRVDSPTNQEENGREG